MGNLIIKGKGGAGNKLIIQDQAGAAVLTTNDSGATLANGLALGTPASGVVTNLTGTLGANITFPAGHILQTNWDEWAPSTNPSMDITSEAAPMGSNLEVTITPKSTSNALNIRCFIPDMYNHGVSTRALMAGFRYSTASNFSSSVKLGTKQFPVSHEMYIGANYAFLNNLMYEVWVAAPTTSQIWI